MPARAQFAAPANPRGRLWPRRARPLLLRRRRAARCHPPTSGTGPRLARRIPVWPNRGPRKLPRSRLRRSRLLNPQSRPRPSSSPPRTWIPRPISGGARLCLNNIPPHRPISGGAKHCLNSISTRFKQDFAIVRCLEDRTPNRLTPCSEFAFQRVARMAAWSVFRPCSSVIVRVRPSALTKPSKKPIMQGFQRQGIPRDLFLTLHRKRCSLLAVK